MNPCTKCGKEVRLGGMNIRVNRKHGVLHYIDHMRASECDGVDGWECTMMKPYPATGKPRELMVECWNVANPAPPPQRAIGDEGED